MKPHNRGIDHLDSVAPNRGAPDRNASRADWHARFEFCRSWPEADRDSSPWSMSIGAVRPWRGASAAVRPD